MSKIPIKPKLKRLRHKTLTEQVYEILEKKIIFCEIEPGTVLTEREITEIVGAGRTPVREALLLLSKRYLINISKAGIIIPEMNASLQLQLLEVRRALLITCVDSAIKRMTKDDKENIKTLLTEVDILDEKEFLEWLEKRQDILAKASKNYFIYEGLRNVLGLSRRFWYRYANDEQHREVREMHKNILQAVYNGNNSEAIKAVHCIIDYFENFVKQHII